ncbi:transcriptional regulator [Cellulomonas septica]|uniref:Transcriptional regulator n=1 Tax=Cellulomonas septica TaxID=285080 RepID=A0ABX1JVF5_9CELL|nr:transcriptional regulator [Cellulomonas septica]NKY38294.1 transcriptional regulator [Cellulomonas septica]
MSESYVLHQWAQAQRTAASHPDAGTRGRAGDRARSWGAVLDGMRSGALRIGRRDPVRDLPVWVTPEVIRGGFATGAAAAGGPLTTQETVAARDAGLPPDRRAVFEHHLGESGLRRLWERLDDGSYAVDLPEHAALLTVAWLVRAGRIESAASLVAQLRPYADQLCFVPREVVVDPAASDDVWVVTAGEARTRLDAHGGSPHVREMNEALGVWAPFTDRLVAHWLRTSDGERLDSLRPDGWLEDSRALLREYADLAARHTLNRKHRNPKHPATILRIELERAVAGESPWRNARVEHAVRALVAKRGVPGSPDHVALRTAQAEIAARPTSDVLTSVVAARLTDVEPSRGIREPEAFEHPVDQREASRWDVPAGTPVPPAATRQTSRARAGTIDDLLERGVIGSSEVLAGFLPELTGEVIARDVADPVLRRLVARTYAAFRRRRSLLLLDLAHQVRTDELPWVAAVAHERSTCRGDDHVATIVRFADLSTRTWPGTMLPNPVVAELDALARAGGLGAVFTELVAADIFQGRFSTKFADAFLAAQGLLDGSRYARYYGIPSSAWSTVATAHDRRGSFSTLARDRATPEHRWCVVCNGRVVEQSLVLTTHNLAALVRLGWRPQEGWAAQAERTFDAVLVVLDKVGAAEHNPRLRADLAHAWRQTVFAVSMLPAADQPDLLLALRQRADRARPVSRARASHLVAGLQVADGREPFVGWVHGRHPLLDVSAGIGS